MHLAELLALRTRPAAGLLLALTRRCPLHCAHCSTNSTMAGREHSGAALRRLVATFTAQEHPQLVFMSGGEPLLRPGLVADLADSARTAGTRSVLLSGMFFARGAMPRPIRRAISRLDHFSASIDIFHEREVSRAEVFAALHQILDLVPAVSLHVVSSDESYLDDLLPQIRQTFGDRVPSLVARIQPSGRGRRLVTAPAEEVDPGPCEFANWPLVDYDGTVFACSRQSLARRYRPDHLVLGHAARDTWAQLRQRTLAQPVLSSVRAVGAMQTAERAGVAPCAGVCQTCVGLSDARSPALTQPPSPAVALLASQMLHRLRPRDLARRWGAGRHADLVELGWTP